MPWARMSSGRRATVTGRWRTAAAAQLIKTGLPDPWEDDWVPESHHKPGAYIQTANPTQRTQDYVLSPMSVRRPYPEVFRTSSKHLLATSNWACLGNRCSQPRNMRSNKRQYLCANRHGTNSIAHALSSNASRQPGSRAGRQAASQPQNCGFSQSPGLWLESFILIPLSLWYCRLWKNTPFEWAPALQSFSRNCRPAPDLVLRKPIFLIVVFFGGVFFHRHQYHALPWCHADKCAISRMAPEHSWASVYMRNLLGWLETRLAQNNLNYLGSLSI